MFKIKANTAIIKINETLFCPRSQRWCAQWLKEKYRSTLSGEYDILAF